MLLSPSIPLPLSRVVPHGVVVSVCEMHSVASTTALALLNRSANDIVPRHFRLSLFESHESYAVCRIISWSMLFTQRTNIYRRRTQYSRTVDGKEWEEIAVVFVRFFVRARGSSTSALVRAINWICNGGALALVYYTWVSFVTCKPRCDVWVFWVKRVCAQSF